MNPHRDSLHWSRPVDTAARVRTGALVLDDSAGDRGVGRTALLAALGVDAVAPLWFAPSSGQGPRLDRLESFVAVLDLLAADFDRVVVWGHGRGAEAALLVASLDDRVDGVVALAPSDVVWQGSSTPGEAEAVSSWTWQDRALPFVPFDQPAATGTCDRHEQARSDLTPIQREAATIPVERIRGDVVCVAGASDPVWPSATAANAIEARRTAHGLATRVVIDSTAGHEVVFPAQSELGLAPLTPDSRALTLGQLARPAVRRLLAIPELR